MHNIICNFITISYAISKNDVMFFYTRITLQFNAWSIVSFLFYFYDIIYAYLLIRLNVYQSIEHTITAPRGEFILHGRPYVTSSREEKNWVLAQIIL